MTALNESKMNDRSHETSSLRNKINTKRFAFIFALCLVYFVQK